ncbi:MAG: cysteine hydrolase family protein [Halanaeroarchaeum sp.]
MTGVDLAATLNPERMAILIVDAQRAFVHEESPIARDGRDLSPLRETVPRVRDLVDTGRDADASIAYTRTVRSPREEHYPENRYDAVPGIRREGGPLCCLRGAWDTEYAAGIDPLSAEFEIEKVGYDAFHGTRLDVHLRTAGVDTVVGGGFMTDVCVEGTLRGAHERGYDVVLAEDACASRSETAHDQTLHFVDSYLGTTASVEEIRRAL